MQVDPAFVQERSLWVILRDYEQESEIVLMLWAIALIVEKGIRLRRDRDLFGRDFVPLAEGMRILPVDVREHTRSLQALPEEERSSLLPRALLAGLHRFGATGSVADASASAHGVCEGEADRLDSELSLLRYIAWAIPAIGFIGTVRGIGDALAQAHRAMQGDLSGVTQGLGTAFNSTLVALLLSLVLMFLLHHLQTDQERLVRDAESYLDERLLASLRVA
jgi:biopolymer transport protein ExbB/TolQ